MSGRGQWVPCLLGHTEEPASSARGSYSPAGDAQTWQRLAQFPKVYLGVVVKEPVGRALAAELLPQGQKES